MQYPPKCVEHTVNVYLTSRRGPVGSLIQIGCGVPAKMCRTHCKHVSHVTYVLHHVNYVTMQRTCWTEFYLMLVKNKCLNIQQTKIINAYIPPLNITNLLIDNILFPFFLLFLRWVAFYITRHQYDIYVTQKWLVSVRVH